MFCSSSPQALQKRLFVYNPIRHGLPAIRNRDLQNFCILNICDFSKHAYFQTLLVSLLIKILSLIFCDRNNSRPRNPHGPNIFFK